MIIAVAFAVIIMGTISPRIHTSAQPIRFFFLCRVKKKMRKIVDVAIVVIEA
jgi:hypothetical protein